MMLLPSRLTKVNNLHGNDPLAHANTKIRIDYKKRTHQVKVFSRNESSDKF